MLAERGVPAGGQLVGARRPRPGGPPHARASAAERRDQLARLVPAEPHAALGRVHRLRHPEAPRPQVAPVGERRVPVDAPRRPTRRPRADRPPRGRRREHARAKRLARRARRQPAGRGRSARAQPSATRQQQLAGGGDAHGASSGTSSIRRSSHERSASSASWIPLRALEQVPGKGSSPATWRRNISHWTLKPLS